MSIFDNYYETGDLPICPNCGESGTWFDRVKVGAKPNPADPTGQTPMPYPIHHAACGICDYEVEV